MWTWWEDILVGGQNVSLLSLLLCNIAERNTLEKEESGVRKGLPFSLVTFFEVCLVALFSGRGSDDVSELELFGPIFLVKLCVDNNYEHNSSCVSKVSIFRFVLFSRLVKNNYRAEYWL